MLEQGLVVLLLANTGVKALVAARIYPVQGPPDQPVYPYITYQDIPAAATEYTFDTGADMDNRGIQFAYWGLTAGDGMKIMIAMRNALSGLAGVTLADADATRIIFAKHGTFLNNFDVDSHSYRSVDEYEFQISEP